MIAVIGEALIDLVPTASGALEAHLGGGPFNTAVALGRLGAEVGYVGGLSTDAFGQRLRARLVEAGVVLDAAPTTDDPTTLALVEFGANGDAAYRFYVAETSASELTPDHVAHPLLAAAAALHVGTLAFVLEPMATSLDGLLPADGRPPADRLVMIDPNVRPAIIGTRPGYRARLDRWLGAAHVVKVSDADLAWLAPGADPVAVAEGWLAAHPGMLAVLVTQGGAGVALVARVGRADVPATPTTVADTIGAGDSFSAGVLAALAARDALDPGRLAALDRSALVDVVAFAGAVAARTCSRPGADPPWRHEVAW